MLEFNSTHDTTWQLKAIDFANFRGTIRLLSAFTFCDASNLHISVFKQVLSTKVVEVDQ